MTSQLPDEAQEAQEAQRAQRVTPVRRTKGPQLRKDAGRGPGGSDAVPAQAMQDAMAEIQACELALEKPGEGPGADVSGAAS